MKKFEKYIIFLFLTIFITFLAISFFSFVFNKVLFFSAFLISLIVSVIFAYIWNKKHNNLFESFLCFLTFALININLSSLAPIFIDRSLSVFIYFYTAENKTISKNIYDEEYYKNFSSRRIKDAETMHFIECNKNICKPMTKAKFAYFILKPIGKLTNSLNNYQEFKKFIQEK